MVESRQVDAFLWDHDPILIEGEQPLVHSLEPFIAETEEFDEAIFLLNLLDAFRWGGNPYTLPAEVDVERIDCWRG
jgi:ABC-type glycerol-3-phosphate transport system substrate-binding protein